MTRAPRLAAALALALMLAGAAGAQPQGGGRGGMVRQACAADLQKLCPDAKPGPGGTMRQCMRDHFADLSDGCKAAIAQMRARRQGGGEGAPSGGQ